MKLMMITVAALAAGSGWAHAQLTANETARLVSAAQVVREIDQTVPGDLWSRARCVAVIPDLKKAAFMVGGEYGKGVMSCRAGDAWSAPVFMQLAKGSWGFQLGAEQVDVVLLVMNESGVEKLLRNKVSLGADASIAAGPVGRQGHAGTDAQLTAEILSYSRAQGLFAGVDLSGGVLRPDEDANRDAYGPSASPRTILASRGLSAPTQATAFLNALSTHAAVSPRPAAPAGGAPAAAAGAGQATSGATPAGTPDELRGRIADMRATLDRLLDSASPAPSGATGTGTTAATGTTGTTSAGTEASASGNVTVNRADLLQLRQQLDGLVLALNSRR